MKIIIFAVLCVLAYIPGLSLIGIATYVQLFSDIRKETGPVAVGGALLVIPALVLTGLFIAYLTGNLTKKDDRY